MLVEFVAAGIIIGAILLGFGWYSRVLKDDNKGNLFIVAGALALIICGLLIAADSTGIEVQTYGGCVNQSITNYTYGNVTYYHENEAAMNETLLVQETTNYTYGQCYHNKLDFGYTEALMIMLILAGIGTLLGVIGWSKYGNIYKNV